MGAFSHVTAEKVSRINLAVLSPEAESCQDASGLSDTAAASVLSELM